MRPESGLRATAQLRAAAVGALSATLSVAAHAVGGGMVPSVGPVLLLLALGAVLGTGAAAAARLRTSAVVLLLGAGQVVGHLVLAASADHMSMPLTRGMLGAHAGAVLVAAVLVLVAERVGPRCAAALGRLLPVPVRSPLVAVRRAPVPVTPLRTPTLSLLFTTSLGRRGPPVGA